MKMWMNGLVMGCLVFSCHWVTATPPSETMFSVEDPRGDDFGTGMIRYPSNNFFREGDLDLLRFTATAHKKGTWFEAEFANRIKSPENEITSLGAEPLKNFVKYDFFTINIDIYIDTDGRSGSGNRTTLPGRKIEVADETAWEKAILVTPRPLIAKSLLKKQMSKARIAQEEAVKGKISDDGQNTLKGEVEQVLDQQFYFPTQIKVRNRKLRFFVPNSFLGGKAQPEWRYLVLVSGADPEMRVNLKFLHRKDKGLMILPVDTGRPRDTFGLDFKADVNQPPIVDVLHPSVAEQKRLLSDFDHLVGRLSRLAGIQANAPGKVVSAPKAEMTAKRKKTAPAKPSPTAKAATPEPVTQTATAREAPSVKPNQQVTPPKSQRKSKPTVAARPKPVEKPEPVDPPSKPAESRPVVETTTPPTSNETAAAVTQSQQKAAQSLPSQFDQLLEKPEEKEQDLKRTVTERLRELEGLLKEKLITQEEYEQLRRKILSEL